jgi:hypothetical protein
MKRRATLQRGNDRLSMSLDTPALSVQPALAAPAETSSTPSPIAADLLGRVVAVGDLDKHRGTAPSWLWHGYLGPGKVTLLTSQWKSGKTTLVSLLLARMQQGGQLAGLPVAPGKAFVISEESESDWRPRFAQLGIRDNVDLLCRPFRAQPGMEQWLALIETALAMRQRRRSDLVVIDSLGYFLPAHSENSAGALLECLTPLQRLSEAGMSVLLPHHPRKGKTVAGQAARGSGALPSFVDVIVEMGYYAQPDDLDRRRRLVAFSRHDDTPRHLLIELNADGTDYVVLQSGLEAALGENWPAVLHALSEAHTKLTRQEILDNWSEDYRKPDSTTLWRWLSRAVAQGMVRQEGTGRPRDPFRYWLPAREPFIRPDGGSAKELQAWNDRCVAELVARMEQTDGAQSAPEASQSGKECPGGGPAVAGVQAEEMPREPVPPPESGPESAASTSPAAGPLPSQAAQPVVAEAPVRLPYPFNMMNPADVPEEVWKQARTGKENTW